MNPRVTAIVVGLLTLAFGLAALVYPERMMGLLGYSVLTSSQTPAVLGEVRATYGGLFVVMGVYTLLAGLDPAAHRARLMFIGLLWWGACSGRLLGVYVDGNPGVPGWATASFEFLAGGALVVASFARSAAAAPAAQVSPAPAVPSAQV
jgi:drug/metabolite transporter superfamily protein YnfA